LLYSIGFKYSNYNDSTIYDKLSERHFQQSFRAAYEVVQKWGSIDLSLDYRNYLYDWSKNNLSLDGFIDVRIAKGLSVNFGGGASLIHDQLAIVKGGALRRKFCLEEKNWKHSLNISPCLVLHSLLDQYTIMWLIQDSVMVEVVV